MRKILLACMVVAFVWQPAFAQKKPAQVPATEVVPADIALFKNLEYRLIGPFRGGRSAAVAGSYKDKNTFYFGSTGGGVWKTQDGGSNWKNVSDGFFGSSIGAVAVAPSDESIVYVGEGEKTMRGNVSEGLGGMWRSDNAGKTWRNIGIRDGRHIVRIKVHPKNPDVLWVAVMGHLFGPSNDRGIFKSEDGGKSWKHVLFVNEQTGAFEIVPEPGDPNILYATTWRVIRQPHTLESGGEGSGLWKSTDGGDTWKNISASKGLPKGIWGINAVAVAPSNPQKVYALIENEKGGLYMSEDAGQTWALRSSDNNIRQRAWYYTRVFVDPANENLVYCPNVNFMVSRDGGRTFSDGSNTPHGDHHDLWIDPENGKRMIVADDGGAQVSFDAGGNWSTYMNQPTAQVYRVSTDNAFPYRVMGGQQDNSAFRLRSRTYGRSISNDELEDAAGAESGYVVADPLNPEITYGGNYMGMLQRLDHKTGASKLINVWPIDNMGAGADAARYRFQWNYPIFFSPHNPKRLYAAGNHLFYTENEGQSWTRMSPDLTTDDKSKQGPSGGPITKDNTSVEYYCTIFTAAESALEKGVVWTGSDDGLVYLTRDDGANWANVTPPNIPGQMMWNCVDIDTRQKGTAYLAGTRYKLDDFTPYMFKTEDYGKTWKRIDAGIPRMHFTRAIRADHKRAGLLYAGTEYGLYISYNDGASWQRFQLNLPITPVTDMTIKNNDLIVATQGRSLWILDDLSVVQQYDGKLPTQNLTVYNPAPAYRMAGGGGRGFGNFGGNDPHAGKNPPSGAVIPFYLKQVTDETKGSVLIMDAAKKEIVTYSTSDKDRKIELKEGLNQFAWNLYYPEGEKVADGTILWNRARMMPMAPPGNYVAKIKVGADSAEVPFTVVPDPNFEATQADYEAQFNFLRKTQGKFDEVVVAQKEMANLKKQMKDYETRMGKDMPKEVKQMMDSISKKITPIEEALHQTKAKSGQDVLNYPIRLDDKLSSVYRTASVGNGAPSQQVVEAYGVVAGQIDTELSKWNAIKADDVKALNNLIREKSLPVIIPSDK